MLIAVGLASDKSGLSNHLVAGRACLVIRAFVSRVACTLMGFDPILWYVMFDLSVVELDLVYLFNSSLYIYVAIEKVKLPIV